MSFAVPPEHIEEFQTLARERDVEVTVLGEFTDDGIFHVEYDGKTVAYGEAIGAGAHRRDPIS